MRGRRGNNESFSRGLQTARLLDLAPVFPAIMMWVVGWPVVTLSVTAGITAVKLYKLKASVLAFVASFRDRNGRGRCGQCGYDLRWSESPTCPECGATITANGASEGGHGH